MRWWIAKHLHEIAWYSKLRKITNTDWLQSFNNLTIFNLLHAISKSPLVLPLWHIMKFSDLWQRTNTPKKFWGNQFLHLCQKHLEWLLLCWKTHFLRRYNGLSWKGKCKKCRLHYAGNLFYLRIYIVFCLRICICIWVFVFLYLHLNLCNCKCNPCIMLTLLCIFSNQWPSLVQPYTHASSISSSSPN